MRFILKYLNGYKKECVLAPLFKMLEAVFELTVPLIVAAIIDNGIASGNKAYVIKMCIILVALGVIGLILAVTAQYFSAKAAAGYAKRVRSELFNYTQRFSFSQLDSIGTASIINNLTNDVNQLQNGLNLTLRLVLRSPFVVFGAVIMAFTINARLALILVGTVIVLFAVVFTIMLLTVPMYQNVQSKVDSLLLKVKENLSGVRVIRAFVKENDENNKFDILNNKLTFMQKSAGKISALLNPLTYVILNAAVILLLYSGAVKVNSGIISQGAMVALYNYISQILAELIKLANLVIILTKAVASGRRITGVLKVQLETENDNCNFTDKNVAVEFNDVSFKYNKNGDYALHNVTFSVKSGQTVGIIGGTGSGKSTLVNLIPKFYNPTSGVIKVFGCNLKDVNGSKLRNVIGVVPQHPVLFKGTVKSNMHLGNQSASEGEINEALKNACCTTFIEEKGKGILLEVEQGGKNFSGGQRQRLTVARALVNNPAILILDDSSSALDYATEATLRKNIQSLPNSPTVFVVSQRTASISYADLIIVLDNGSVAGIGTHSELLKNCDVYKEIYNSQQKTEV